MFARALGCAVLCHVTLCTVTGCYVLLLGGWLRGVVFSVVVWRCSVVLFDVVCRVGGLFVWSRVSLPRGVV